jgi:hypothetical protein
MDPQSDLAPAVKLAVIDVLDRDGHARLVVPAWRWPVTIGRAIDCDVVLDDAHVAARHASVVERDGVLTLQVGETVNGVQLTRRRIAAGQSAELSAGELFQVGQTRLRVRRAADALPPERPFVRERTGGPIPVLGVLLALTIWNVGEMWLKSEPGGRLVDFVPMLIGTPVLLGIWSVFWSVGSKLVTQRFDFWSHAHVVLRYALIMSVVFVVLPLTAYSFGWAFLSRVAGIAAFGVAWAMLLAHLTLIFPARRRILSGVMAALLVAGTSLFLVRNYQVHERVFPELYVTTLAPPAMRLAPAVPTARFIDEAHDLKAALDAHAKDTSPAGSSEE